MPVTYALADQAVLDVLDTVRDTHFRDIQNADLKIEVLLATADDPEKPALKHYGMTALAVIKIVGPEERSTGGPDVRIKVDAAKYYSLGARQREALFAHELNHVVFRRDDKGQVKRDDYGRPVVRLKPDDYAINGFIRIHQLYGDDSVERMTYQSVGRRLGQQTFDFMQADHPDPMADADAAAPLRR